MAISIEELKLNSGLPGPRGNLELLYRYIRSCTQESVTDCLDELSPETSDSPEEFVGMCGVVGFAMLNFGKREILLEHLKKYSKHSSWRIRESVAIAIQEIPVNVLSDRLELTKALEDDDPLVCRAIIAGLCEPNNLKGQSGAKGVYDHLNNATNLLLGKTKLTDGEDSLKKALGYCWSVALTYFFEEGRRHFENLVETDSKPVRWIVKENLKKNRLIKTNESWVNEQNRKLIG